MPLLNLIVAKPISFALKLSLFELAAIRDSKNDDLKKKLRQSKNKIDTLKVAFDIVG